LKWVAVKFLHTKVPCTLGWSYIFFIVLWLFHLVCILVVLTGFVMCGCVDVWMCGCFDNCVGVC